MAHPLVPPSSASASRGFLAGVKSVAPPPPKSTRPSGIGGMSVGTAKAVSRAATPPPPVSDIQSSGSGYGAKKADAFKHTPAYRKAVVDVFMHQPAGFQRVKLAQRLIRSGTIEGKIIGGLFKQSGPDFKSSSGLAAAGLGDPTTMLALGVAKNAISDAVNLPSQTIQGVAGLVDQLGQGHFGKAAGMIVDPYVHAFEDPANALKHPLDTALLFAGPEATLGHLAGTAARTGVVGERLADAAATERAPLRLGPDVAGAPSPILESRRYSSNVFTKALQTGHENLLRARGFDPNVARPKPRTMPSAIANSLNVGLAAKTRRIPDEMTGVRQMEGREVRNETSQKIRAPRPHKSVENVVSHVLQGVIRTPETAVEDITKEINRLRAAQTGKRRPSEFANRAQVRDLSQALQNQHHLPGAFSAAETLRDIFHKQDAAAVAKGLIHEDQAVRSRVITYAQAHMGAKYDHVGDLPSDNALRYKAAKTWHGDTKRAVTEANGKLEAAVRNEKVALARAGAMRRGALRNRPLPRALYARITKVQRVRAAAEDALNRAKAAERKARFDAHALKRHENETLGPAFVHANGDRLSTDEILQHIKDNGVPDPAYVGHYPGKQAAHRFYQAWKAARGHLSGLPRTGEAFRSGGYDHTYDALVAQGARTSEALTKAGLHDRIVSRLGIGKPKALQTGKHENGYFTPAEARRFAYASIRDDHGELIPGRQPLVPMTAFDRRTPLDIANRVQQPGELEHHTDALELDALQKALDDVSGRNDATRNVVLVPADAIDQFKKQFAPAGGAARKLGQVTQQFRRTVLPYSTHWMLQIGTEAAVRGLVAGVVDPRNILAGRRLMHALQKTPEGRNMLREMVNATFYNKNDPLRKFNPNPSPTMQALRHSPAGLVIGAHNRYADFIGHGMGLLEHEFRLMALGKFARQEVNDFTHSFQATVRLQGESLGHLVDKLHTDPALVARLGREIDETLGKYNKLSPRVRAATQTWAPFLPWYLNAAKFVLWNLPTKHPVASSLLAATRLTLANDLALGKQEPLNAYQEQALAKLTPFGILPESVPGETGPLGQFAEIWSSAFLPQIAGVWNAVHGQDVFGTRGLYGPAGPEKAFSLGSLQAGVEAGLEAMLPLVRDVRLAREGGGKSYGTSTLWNPEAKPGTGGGVSATLDRIFNPFHAYDAATNADIAKVGAKAPKSSGLDFSGAGATTIGKYDFGTAGSAGPGAGGSSGGVATGGFDFSGAG